MLRVEYFTFVVFVLLYGPRFCFGSCEVDSFAVQENFNITKYLGTWYEMKWLPPPSDDPSMFYRDYTHVYTADGNGKIKGETAGRDAKREMCYYKTIYLEETSTPGKLQILKTNANAADYWVMDTDYDNYAVAYGCLIKNPVDGTCNTSNVWVWSRRQTFSDQLWQSTDTKLESLCVNVTALVKTTQNKECPDASGAPSYLQSDITVFSFLILSAVYYITTH